MDALTYLKSICKEMNEINRLREEISFMEDSLSVHGIDLSRDRVQASRRYGAGYEESIARIEETRERILSRIADLLSKHEIVIRQLSELPEASYSDALYYRYLLGMKWDSIAEKLHYSETYIRELHGKALRSFEEVHREYLKSC